MVVSYARRCRPPGILTGIALALSLFGTGCEQQQKAASPVISLADDPALGPALADSGGCAMDDIEGNGLTSNGLSGNGICQNGLAAKALDMSGLKWPGFAKWFNVNPALSDMVMKYVYRCAAGSGASISWTNPTTGASYTWLGGLGLAPGWTGGAKASVAEQQVVSACLGALTNKYGVSVTIAVEGRTATGTQLSLTPTELADFPQREGCFFGNLFSNQGVFVGADYTGWNPAYSSVRACTLSTAAGQSSDCPPLINVGLCSAACKRDVTNTFYESCTYNGVTYKALNTRVKWSDIYRCGDGVCQMTEKCGTGTSADSCQSDCGVCP